MKQSEREVTADCIGWLRSQGWTCRRQHVGTFQPITGGSPVKIGEGGESDWICRKPATPTTAYLFELELKATGKRPRSDQFEYMAKRIHQGFLATWADSLDQLKEWYADTFPASVSGR